MDTPLFSSILDFQLRKVLQSFNLKNPAWTLKNNNNRVCLEVCWEQCPTKKAPAVAKAKKKSPSTKRRDRRRFLQWLAKTVPEQASSPPGPADEVIPEVNASSIPADDMVPPGPSTPVKDSQGPVEDSDSDPAVAKDSDGAEVVNYDVAEVNGGGMIATNDGDADANDSDDPVSASGSPEVELSSRYHHPPKALIDRTLGASSLGHVNPVFHSPAPQQSFSSAWFPSVPSWLQSKPPVWVPHQYDVV